MTDEEYEISQEENPFGGQDDYLEAMKAWEDKHQMVKDLIEELDNQNLSDQLVASVTRDILTEKDSNFGWHRFIVKPLFKILKDRGMNEMLSDIVADNNAGQWVYWISGDWGSTCVMCDEYDLFHDNGGDGSDYICHKCSLARNKNPNMN